MTCIQFRAGCKDSLVSLCAASNPYGITASVGISNNCSVMYSLKLQKYDALHLGFRDVNSQNAMTNPKELVWHEYKPTSSGDYRFAISVSSGTNAGVWEYTNSFHHRI